MVRPGLRHRQEAIDSELEFFSHWQGLGEAVEKRSLNGGVSFPRLLEGIAPILSLYNVRVPFTIRDYQPEDFETLWRLDQECFPPEISYSRMELKVYMRKRGSFTLVAADAIENENDNDKIAGFIVAHAGRTGHIITIDVIAAARRFGIGSQLLRAAEDRLRAAGSRAVGLETAVDNVSALSFYKRHGYSVVKTWPRYYSNSVDALVLVKNLI
jgi:ribosomal-protein-alanine N-acetyltransferase